MSNPLQRKFHRVARTTSAERATQMRLLSEAMRVHDSDHNFGPRSLRAPIRRSLHGVFYVACLNHDCRRELVAVEGKVDGSALMNTCTRG